MSMRNDENYKEWKVWQDAMNLAEKTFAVEFKNPNIVHQLERALISIPANIAEGIARGRGYLVNHFRFAKGSAAEVETLVILAQRIGIINEDTANYLTIITQDVQEQLGELIRTLNIKSRIE